MTTFMLYLFALNLRFAPHPQAGSKSRVICFCMAGMTTRFKMELVTIFDRLTIEIVGFITYLLLSECLSAARWRHDMSTSHSESNICAPAVAQRRAKDIPICSQKMLISPLRITGR